MYTNNTHSLSPFSFFLVAMQFGQLLTHLDTTQQMINNSLKDNNTLLTQVRSQTSTAQVGLHKTVREGTFHLTVTAGSTVIINELVISI